MGIKTANAVTRLRSIQGLREGNHGVFFTFFKALNLPGESFNETSLWCQSEGNSLTSLSGFGLIALPLHGSVTQGGYEDIHHSGLGGFKVFFFFPGEKGLKSIEVSRNIRLV